MTWSGLESRRDGHCPSKAHAEKSGARQERERERYLGDNEGAPKAQGGGTRRAASLGLEGRRKSTVQVEPGNRHSYADADRKRTEDRGDREASVEHGLGA